MEHDLLQSLASDGILERHLMAEESSAMQPELVRQKPHVIAVKVPEKHPGLKRCVVANSPARRTRMASAALPACFGIAKARQSECLSNEVHTGLAAARILHVKNNATGFHHRTKADVADLLLMEDELRRWLLHGFLARPLERGYAGIWGPKEADLTPLTFFELKNRRKKTRRNLREVSAGSAIESFSKRNRFVLKAEIESFSKCPHKPLRRSDDGRIRTCSQTVMDG
ncbi:hypothetical protein AAFX91_26495 [Bradyrhizobium sp. 31Argb]|uniref:hypothetical protein n=1 Tax=Bradyrhizobium sp. 31Argb TaxID=3141247 RepID=UPI0037490DB7